MGLDRAPIEFQTFYFLHVWLDPPTLTLIRMSFITFNLTMWKVNVNVVNIFLNIGLPGKLGFEKLEYVNISNHDHV